ncbi:hypothetical protein HXZ66_11045 [Bacillus sp. A116_S68]|nr:hypothetical protein HXZ66_11045 [Bacillus sp. A116_S68]
MSQSSYLLQFFEVSLEVQAFISRWLEEDELLRKSWKGKLAEAAFVSYRVLLGLLLNKCRTVV